jgi:hypothetical protein
MGETATASTCCDASELTLRVKAILLRGASRGGVKPTGHYMYRQFNIQQFYILLTLYLCVLCGSENKQRLFLYTALTGWFV